MPQMFPLNWIMLYIFFTIIFIIFNIVNYYNISLIKKFNYPNNMKYYSKKMNWKW